MMEYIYNAAFWEYEPEVKFFATRGWFLVLAVGLALRRFYNPDHLRVMAFVAYSLLMEYVCTSQAFQALFFNDVGTSPLYHILTPGLFFFMALIFTDYLFRGKNKKWGVGLIVGFLLISVGSALWPGISGDSSTHVWEGLKAFPMVSVGVYSITGILLPIGYFLYLFNKLDDLYLEKLPMFWISTGLLIYYSGNFLMWISISFLTYDAKSFFSIYRINGYLTVLLHFLLIVALLLNPKSQTPNQLTTES